MDTIIDYISSNYKWIFSGIGAVLLGIIYKILKGNNGQKQSISNNSIGIQSGGDVKIKIGKKKKSSGK